MNVQDIVLFLLFTVSLLVMPLGVAFALSAFGGVTKQKLTNRFGVRSQSFIGGLGVIIHELGHMTFAFLFLHHITSFKLLRLRRVRESKTLGYVNHTWGGSNLFESLYESLGNFFIGIAPCFFCSGVLWFAHGLLLNNRSLSYGSVGFENMLRAVFSNIVDPLQDVFSWQMLVYLLLVILVSCTGYELSDADWKNTRSGIIYWVVVLLLVYIATILFGFVAPVTVFLWKAMTLWLSFLGRGIIYIFISWLVLELLDQL